VKELEEAIEGYFTADAFPRSLTTAPGISGKVTATTAAMQISNGSSSSSSNNR